MNIAVYLASTFGNGENYKQLTIELGHWLVKHNCNLVYGGGNSGLMGVLADEVIRGKQEVYGVIPEFLVELELKKDGLTSIDVVSTMQERKLRMIQLSDAFIALPGGPGTLEEISEVISLRRVKQHNKPCILLNFQGYYDNLKAQYLAMIDAGFINKVDLAGIHFIDTVDELDGVI